jgi:hypothetical protein
LNKKKPRFKRGFFKLTASLKTLCLLLRERDLVDQNAAGLRVGVDIVEDEHKLVERVPVLDTTEQELAEAAAGMGRSRSTWPA